MTSNDLKTRVEQALRAVKHPRTGADVLILGLVQDLTVDAGAGSVGYTFHLGKDDPGALARVARKAVQAVPGVTAVRAQVQEASTATGPAAALRAQLPCRPRRRPTNSLASARSWRFRRASAG